VQVGAFLAESVRFSSRHGPSLYAAGSHGAGAGCMLITALPNCAGPTPSLCLTAAVICAAVLCFREEQGEQVERGNEIKKRV